MAADALRGVIIKRSTNRSSTIISVAPGHFWHITEPHALVQWWHYPLRLATGKACRNDNTTALGATLQKRRCCKLTQAVCSLLAFVVHMHLHKVTGIMSFFTKHDPIFPKLTRTVTCKSHILHSSKPLSRLSRSMLLFNNSCHTQQWEIRLKMNALFVPINCHPTKLKHFYTEWSKTRKVCCMVIQLGRD